MNKASFLLLLLLLVVPFAAVAQVHRAYTKPEATWEYLFKGSWQLHTLAQEQFKSNFHSGWSAGVGFKAPLAGKWWVQPEFLYSSRSISLTYPADADVREATYTFNYLEIPLLLNYRLNKIIELQLGAQAGILISNTVQAADNAAVIELTTIDLQQIDYALAAGLEINMSPLAVGLRYSYSLPAIATTDEGMRWLGEGKLRGIVLYGALVF